MWRARARTWVSGERASQTRLSAVQEVGQRAREDAALRPVPPPPGVVQGPRHRLAAPAHHRPSTPSRSRPPGGGTRTGGRGAHRYTGRGGQAAARGLQGSPWFYPSAGTGALFADETRHAQGRGHRHDGCGSRHVDDAEHSGGCGGDHRRHAGEGDKISPQLCRNKGACNSSHDDSGCARPGHRGEEGSGASASLAFPPLYGTRQSRHEPAQTSRTVLRERRASFCLHSSGWRLRLRAGSSPCRARSSLGIPVASSLRANPLAARVRLSRQRR